MVSLFKRKEKEQKNEQVRILFTSDLHGSDVAFRKFLNAGKMYNANVLIIGGDVAGKALVPIVDLGNGTYQIEEKVIDKSFLAEKIREFSKQGLYYVIISKEEYKEMQENEEVVRKYFKEAMINKLREWIKIADERYADSNIPIYINLGNDDPIYLFDVISESKVMKKCEGEIIRIKDKYEMISFGYANPTPWHTPREMEDEKIYEELKKQMEKVQNPETTILNVHPPPFNTNLDLAPLLDKDLKPVVRGGEIVMQHVGSQGVRKIIEEYQPLLGLHGHIHESRAFDKIGKTIVINPGSEYGEGILHAALVILENEKVKAYQFIIG
ncbi:MAG: metallophosphoesterase [Sulfolobaceae archaeon]|nr:metallophosphoesterase [Sulfolobaceae archaeon]